MAAKKKNDILELSAPGNDLADLINLMKKYSAVMADAQLNFYKGGLRVLSTDNEFVSMIAIAAGKKWFTNFKATKEFVLGMSKSALSDLKQVCRDAGTAELTIRITEDMDKFLMKYNNVNRRQAISYSNMATQKPETIGNIYKGSQKLGTIKMENLQLFTQASASWQGDSDRTCRIVKKGKSFEILTDIEASMNDQVVLDLMEAMDTKFKDKELKMIVHSSHLNNAIKQMKKLTEELTIKGNTDYPLMIMKKDADPEKMLDFKDDLNWWYMLAPRIETE